MTVDVRDKKQLEKLCSAMRRISGVRDVERLVKSINMTTQISTDPEHIAVSKSRGIEIDWKDGHHSSYGIEYLRDWCPCATCAGTHGTEPRPKTTAARAANPASPFQM